MRLLRCLFSIAVALGPTGAHSAENLVSTFWYPTLNDSTELVCEIRRSSEKSPPRRQLLVRNAKSGKLLHSFETIDAPVAMFPLQDAGGNLVTVWTGGTGYRIRLIRYEDGEVDQKLEVNSATFPQFVDLDGDGQPEIMVASRTRLVSAETGARKVPEEYTVYRWSGDSYVQSGKLTPDDLSACYSSYSQRP